MRKDDEQKIDSILTIIRDELEKIVRNQPELFRSGLLAYLSDLWPDIADRIERARDKVAEVDWTYVEGVGLVGRALAAKLGLLNEELKEGGRLEAFFKRANSLLGSLAEIIPILHGVKEYKEHVECSISELQTLRRKSDRWST
jgi:hypothetical protein